MTTYTRTLTQSGTAPYLDQIVANEQDIYGVKRVGAKNITLLTGGLSIPYVDISFSSSGYSGTSISNIAPEIDSIYKPKRTMGLKQYELDNSLGNVIATLSDMKLGQGSGTVSYYEPQIQSYQDYYAFGLFMPKRQLFPSNYRYGFNGKEMDNETYSSTGMEYDYGARIYAPGIGRFLSVDPLEEKFPELSTYQFAGDNSIKYIDLDGLEQAPQMIQMD